MNAPLKETAPQAVAYDASPGRTPWKSLPRPRWLAGRTLAVWSLAAGMGIVGVLLALSNLAGFFGNGVPGREWWLLVSLFGIAEIFVIHLPTLRSAHSHTLREVPAVAGLAFLDPGGYVAAYVVGSAVALLLVRKQRGVKLMFNLSMFTLEAAAGAIVYQAVIGGAPPGELRGWAAAFTAVLVTDLLSAAAVTGAITLSESRFDGGVLREALGPGLVAALVNTCVALLVVVLVIDEPVGLPLLGVVSVVLVVAYKGHVALSTGYSRLQHLYEFVRSSERPGQLDDAVEAILRDACKVFCVECAELVVLPRANNSGSHFSLEPTSGLTENQYSGAVPEPGAWWAPAAFGQPVLHNGGSVTKSEPRRSSGSHDWPRNGMAAALYTEDEVSAVLLVRDRSFEGERFTIEELQFFETLAAHAGVALDKARLVDRLRRLAAEREHEARHDSLTGLPNRRAFLEAVTSVTTDGATGAVLFLDLDDFKDVNDTLGHEAGDTLLQRTGEQLEAVCGGMVARLGGDEFAVLLPGVTPEEAVREARDLHAAAAQPVSLHTFTMVSKVSIGVAMLPDAGIDTSEVLRQADVAMYEAKRMGTGVEMYRPEDSRAVARKLVLAADLPAAVEERRFTASYQPQADTATGKIVGAEALLRWSHPTYGAIPPPEMVALAERTGHLRRLTDAMLDEALRQRAAWAALGYDINMSVNVTPADLRDEALPDTVTRLLEATDTPPARLTLEITEQGVMKDPERCLSVLDSLAERGVQLSVDDFGTGYSSLAYLDRLPVHEVKIDKSFVQRLDADQGSDDIVIRSTVTLAHDLGMRVVAEGLESRMAWTRLVDLGVENVQGYALVRPMPAEQTGLWLREHGTKPHRSDVTHPYSSPELCL
jgi:diguanylate cyclase (GGDEF)-like protein